LFYLIEWSRGGDGESRRWHHHQWWGRYCTLHI